VDLVERVLLTKRRRPTAVFSGKPPDDVDINVYEWEAWQDRTTVHICAGPFEAVRSTLNPVCAGFADAVNFIRSRIRGRR